jgi:hypothetical protein
MKHVDYIQIIHPSRYGNTIDRTEEILAKLKRMNKLVYENEKSDSSKTNSANERQKTAGLHRKDDEDKRISKHSEV